MPSEILHRDILRESIALERSSRALGARAQSRAIGVLPRLAAAAGRQFSARYGRVTAMIGYVTLGTNDLARATAFYDALFAEMGVRRFVTAENFAYWGKGRDLGMLALYRPNDGRPATVGNGVMVALPVRTRERVQQTHRTALSLGAPDEGAPGPRGDNFYGAYFRDPDGNKLCVFTYENVIPEAT